MRHSPIVIYREHYKTTNDGRNGKNSNAVGVKRKKEKRKRKEGD